MSDPTAAIAAVRYKGRLADGDVLDAIRELTAELGYPPTIVELATELARSPANVHYHVDRLVAAGRLRRGPRGHARTLVVVADAHA